MANSTPEERSDPGEGPAPDEEPDLAAELFGGERQPDENDEGWSDALLEQYRLYVGMADNISQRRHQTNAFFLTVNLALVSALSTLARELARQHGRKPLWKLLGELGEVPSGTLGRIGFVVSSNVRRATTLFQASLREYLGYLVLREAFRARESA